MSYVLQSDPIEIVNVLSHSIGSVAATYIGVNYPNIRSCILQAPVASAYDAVF